MDTTLTNVASRQLAYTMALTNDTADESSDVSVAAYSGPSSLAATKLPPAKGKPTSAKLQRVTWSPEQSDSVERPGEANARQDGSAPSLEVRKASAGTNKKDKEELLPLAHLGFPLHFIVRTTRWNAIRPDRSVRAWTNDEDAHLLAFQKENGNKWLDCAKSLPGRTNYDCKNRFTQIKGTKKASRAYATAATAHLEEKGEVWERRDSTNGLSENNRYPMDSVADSFLVAAQLTSLNQLVVAGEPREEQSQGGGEIRGSPIKIPSMRQEASPPRQQQQQWQPFGREGPLPQEGEDYSLPPAHQGWGMDENHYLQAPSQFDFASCDAAVGSAAYPPALPTQFEEV
ncbi:hypothetical protein THAOC_22712 [Thalassiosira oceanica]|uniref:Uncharacterized protein n=1 Tax=Thalassiosira oceanica TaxID=159749 RepID=K0RXT9_THAOC|nr:hypothetical protein THAOC_22712 [Thalassiosira oceanica]|eukprot:EJK57264.1 hypothetical protein THAOC_22712 [Thalassiosira oceanica]